MKKTVDRTLEIIIVSVTAIVALVVAPLAIFGFMAFGAFIMVKTMLRDWLFEDYTAYSWADEDKSNPPPMPDIPQIKQ